MPEKTSKLKRRRESMPAFVEEALHVEGLFNDYCLRPDYQRNDYLLWINQAKKEETKKKRLNQMLEELRIGGVYMKMSHHPSEKD
jgi:uncharacterized protein YdeI (YjbR/CyaY-like superfamily)